MKSFIEYKHCIKCKIKQNCCSIAEKKRNEVLQNDRKTIIHPKKKRIAIGQFLDGAICNNVLFESFRNFCHVESSLFGKVA